MNEQDWIRLCLAAARRSDCSRVRFGALAIQRGVVAGAGWNHNPMGEPDCAAHCAGGIRRGVRSGTMIERCYAIHAEQHAILNANGWADEIVVLGLLPTGNWFDNGGGFYCTMCARIMRAAGVGTVHIWTADGWRSLTIEEAWRQSYETGLA